MRTKTEIILITTAVQGRGECQQQRHRGWGQRAYAVQRTARNSNELKTTTTALTTTSANKSEQALKCSPQHFE